MIRDPLKRRRLAVHIHSFIHSHTPTRKQHTKDKTLTRVVDGLLGGDGGAL